MRHHDARILRGALIPTAIAGALAIGSAAILAGGEGAVGAAIGLVVVVAFFSIGLLAVTYAARVSPMMMMQAAVFSYLVKVVALVGLITLLKGVTIWDPRAFALTVLGLTVVWVGAEVRGFLRLRVIQLDPPPAGSPAAATTDDATDDATDEATRDASGDAAGGTSGETANSEVTAGRRT
jgi:ATP synthase protein I